AGVARAAGRRRVHALELPDPGAVELARIAQLVEVGGDLARRTGDLAARRSLGRRAAVPELDPGQRPVLVRLVAHQREVARVVVVPEACDGSRRTVRLRVDRAELGADRR